jgi:fatty-acyl-CoA synthase
MEFARRARRLYGSREALVDGNLRLTYEQFFDRCDRWSTVLQEMGVRPHDRVAYIAPNTCALLESFYAVPQIGAVIVPINYRLTSEDFAYIINHSGARLVCAHSDYLNAVDDIRASIPNVKQFIAVEGSQKGWIAYEEAIAARSPAFQKPRIEENDLISINYTSGTTSKPKGVMITHRNAYSNVIGVLIHIPMTARDRYLWTLPMFHANGWTYVWNVTAVGGTHVCLRKTFLL